MRLVAELTRLPGWGILMELLQAGEENLLRQLDAATNDAEVLRLARRWQNFRHWVALTRDEPMRLAEELGALLVQQGIDVELDELRQARLTDLRQVQDNEK